MGRWRRCWKDGEVVDLPVQNPENIPFSFSRALWPFTGSVLAFPPALAHSSCVQALLPSSIKVLASWDLDLGCEQPQSDFPRVGAGEACLEPGRGEHRSQLPDAQRRVGGPLGCDE